MNLFSFVSISALAATLLVGCEPQKETVDPQAATSNKSASARVASAADSYAQMGLDFGNKFDNGVQPTVSMNTSGHVVEVHKSQNDYGLWLRVGRTSGTSISWSKSQQIWDVNNMIVPVYGKNPSVVLRGSSATVVYTNLVGQLCIAAVSISDDGTKIKAAIGQVIDTALDDDEQTISPIYGNNPSVVVTSDKQKIVAYERDHKLYYISAYQDQSGATVWTKQEQVYDTGYNSTIAANSSGQLIEMHEEVVYWRGEGSPMLNRKWGRIIQSGNETKIQWLNPAGEYPAYGTGIHPSVAIDDDGNVVEVHADRGDNSIYRTVATLKKVQYIHPSFSVVGRSVVRNGEYAAVALASVGGRKQVIVNINGGGVPTEKTQLFAGTNGF